MQWSHPPYTRDDRQCLAPSERTSGKWILLWANAPVAGKPSNSELANPSVRASVNNRMMMSLLRITPSEAHEDMRR